MRSQKYKSFVCGHIKLWNLGRCELLQENDKMKMTRRYVRYVRSGCDESPKGATLETFFFFPPQIFNPSWVISRQLANCEIPQWDGTSDKTTRLSRKRNGDGFTWTLTIIAIGSISWSFWAIWATVVFFWLTAEQAHSVGVQPGSRNVCRDYVVGIAAVEQGKISIWYFAFTHFTWCLLDTVS